MTRERPTVTTHNGVTIILVPNADKSLAINRRTLKDGNLVTSRIGYAKNQTPEYADALIVDSLSDTVIEAVRTALAQRCGG